MSYLTTGGDVVPAVFSEDRLHLGHLGWDTYFPPIARREGHEILTREAIPKDHSIGFTVAGNRRYTILSNEDIAMIIRGNQDADVIYFRRARSKLPLALISGQERWAMLRNLVQGAVANFSPKEQKHHALRGSYHQSSEKAIFDIVKDLKDQHSGILSEPHRRKQLYRIGRAIHLIQDAFSPAHMEREALSGGCIRRVRHYGLRGIPLRIRAVIRRTRPPTEEHGVPSDDRDQVAKQPLSSEAAIVATRAYLAIVFKALYGKDRGNPDNSIALRESYTDLDRFVDDTFRLCVSTPNAVEPVERATIGQTSSPGTGMVSTAKVSCARLDRRLPIFKAIGTTDPVGVLEAACQRAVAMLDNVIAELTRIRERVGAGEPVGWPLISDHLARSLRMRMLMNVGDAAAWVGSGPRTAEQVIRWLRNIRKTIAGRQLWYTCLAASHCSTGTWAWVVTLGPYRISLCRAFWQPKTGVDAATHLDYQAQTIIHEVSHIYYVTGDKGRGPGHAECISQFVADANGGPIDEAFSRRCGTVEAPPR